MLHQQNMQLEIIYMLKNPNIKLEPLINASLTSRQSECLYYLIMGMSAKEIGETMSISKRTVEYHIAILKNKLHCRSKSSLIEQGLKLNDIKTKLFENLL
jgi:DNA-binding CsgD family transcriptional regulator